METSPNKPATSPGQANGSPRKHRRAHRAIKIVPLTRENLDGRSNAAKMFDAIASSIAGDLGGEGQLSTVQKHLVEAFAGAALHVGDLNARLLMGEKVDIVAHSQAISTMVRVASRIGVHRLVTRDITPSVADYVEYISEKERERSSRMKPTVTLRHALAGPTIVR